MGAMPFALTASFVLEEGLPLADLQRIALSMGRAAREAGVPVVAGAPAGVRCRADRPRRGRRKPLRADAYPARGLRLVEWPTGGALPRIC